MRNNIRSSVLWVAVPAMTIAATVAIAIAIEVEPLPKRVIGNYSPIDYIPKLEQAIREYARTKPEKQSEMHDAVSSLNKADYTNCMY
jgi:hypothetical protein